MSEYRGNIKEKSLESIAGNDRDDLTAEGALSSREYEQKGKQQERRGLSHQKCHHHLQRCDKDFEGSVQDICIGDSNLLTRGRKRVIEGEGNEISS